MKTKLPRLLFLLLLPMFAIVAMAQSGYVTVTATVPGYAGGQATASFQNQSSASQLPLLNNSVFPTTGVSNLDFSGKFTLTLADNGIIQPTPSQWQIIVCAKSGNQGQPCYPVTLTITCTTGGCTNGVEDISSSFSGAPVPIGPPGQLPTTPYAGQIITTPNAGNIYAAQPQVYYAQNGDTLSSIEAQCVAACTYYVTRAQTITLSASHTLAGNINLQFLNGGSWTVNGAGNTLTIPGQVGGTLTPHFSGSATVKFGTNQALVPVEWFGAVADANLTGAGTDDTAAIQNCENALTAGQCLLQQGYYKTSAAITITRSNIGIQGTIPGGVNFQTSTPVPATSGLVSSSASADIVDVVGTDATHRIYYNRLEDFSLQRSVVPTGTAAGLSLNYAGGSYVYRVQSMDSVRCFYFHSAPSYGVGAIDADFAGWGFASVTEPNSGTYTGFYLDSADGNAQNSLRIRNSLVANNVLGSAITTHGMDVIGTAINDIMVDVFETAVVTIGENINYTGSQTPPGVLGSASDIHFTGTINDGFITSGFLIQNLPADTAAASLLIDGGWNTSTATTVTRGIDIENSSGVTVVNTQMYLPNDTSAGIHAFNCNHIVIANNQLLNVPTVAIDLSSTFNSSVTANAINDLFQTFSTAINVFNSSKNAVTGNTVSGSYSNGLAFTGTSAGNVGAYDNAIDPANVTNPVVDTAGGNLNLTVGGHLNSSSTATPTAAIQTAAGTGATVSITGNDVRGVITIHAVATGGAAGNWVVVTFANPYAAAPIVLLQANNGGVNDASGLLVSQTTTGFTIVSNASPTTATVVLNYIVIG